MSFELLDDQLASAALQDALAFIDAYEQSSPASAPSPASASSFALIPVALPELPPSPVKLTAIQEIVVASPKAKKQRQSVKNAARGGAARPKNRNHGDPKAELERLRHDVKLLESKLAVLKRTSEPPLQSYGSPGSMSLSSNSTSSEDDSLDGGSEPERSLTSMWKSVALRQYQRRNRSEVTNRNLKQVLDRQIKVAKALEGLFAKRTHQNDLDLVYDSPSSISHLCESAPLARDDSISALLVNQVQQLRFEIDLHLINCGLAGSESRILRTLSKPDLFLGTVQETTSNTALPLSLHNADYVLWGGMKMHHRQQLGEPPKAFSYVEDGVDKSYMTVVKSVQYSYNLATRSVMRKFVDQDRIIYAWTSIAAVKNKNVRFRGEGLVVLERSTSSPFDSTLMKNWHRLYAEEIDQLMPSASASEIEKFKATGLRALSQGTSEYFDSLENALLEAASNKPIAQRAPVCMPCL